MDFEELLEQISLNVYEALEHQDYPFDLLVRDLNPNRYANRQPIVNVIYGFQNFTDVHLDLGTGSGGTPTADSGHVEFHSFDLTFKTSKFDLTLFVEDQGQSLVLTMEYDTGLFFPESIQKMLISFENFARTLSHSREETL
jgi:non-ribosomal peptide synthetase component F